MAKSRIFVAYPYSIPREDYRRVFEDLEDTWKQVSFVYADAEITNQAILDKIVGMVRESRFSLFDITGWNPNVTLELGVAIGAARDYYLLFRPTDEQPDAPADLRGHDRVQYRSYKELSDGVAKILAQQLGRPDEDERADFDEQIAGLRDRAVDMIGREPGLTMQRLATSLAAPVPMVQLAVKPLVAEDPPTLETRGQRKGTKYYILGEAPA
ncbi:MAG: hypothetical protein AB7O78_02610 [Thermoleophilia bacterium]